MSVVVQTAIDIEAPIERVFEIILDFPSYSAWNPFVVAVTGEARLGAVIWLDVRFHDGRTHRAKERIEVLEHPGERAELTYRVGGGLARFNLVRALRRQVLTRLDTARTRYETDETFTGLLTGFLPIEGVRRGFEAGARGLKRRAELSPST